MKTSDMGIIALIGHEGIVPGPYFDGVGVLTAYVGHTKAAGGMDPADLPAGMPADLDAALREVFRVFREDLAKFEAEVDRAITVPVEQHEFDAAVSFHFNTGAIARADWVKKLNAGDRAGAAAAIMNWSKPASIIGRRTEEQELFRDGVYPDDPITVWKVNANKHVVWKAARTLLPADALALMKPEEVSVPEAEIAAPPEAPTEPEEDAPTLIAPPTQTPAAPTGWLPRLLAFFSALLKGKPNA
ncbi:lysozyme [Thioclava kandeliae]|uniref:Lysozyme n=1 Tax=Thioclava kandeliae TaxID=3070818 RepID=A0ABV1SFQ1_9RHOB